MSATSPTPSLRHQRSAAAWISSDIRETSGARPRTCTGRGGGAWLAAISCRSQLDPGAISVGYVLWCDLCAPCRWSGRAEISPTLRRPPPSTACARHACMSASRWRPVASASASASAVTRAYHRRSDAAQAQAMQWRRSQSRQQRPCRLARPRHRSAVRSRGVGDRRYLPCRDSRRDRVPSAHIGAIDQRSAGAYLGDISANILSECYLALRVEGADRRAMGEQQRRRRHTSQRRRVVQRRVSVTILGARVGAGTEEQPRDGRLATRCGEV